MENASKALLMAGGMLMTMIIIGMFLLMYNNLTVFFSEDSQANREAQIVKFNEAYESYNRDDENNLVRGTEMLSLLAKVQHYNIYKSDSEGTLVGYKPMTINIIVQPNQINTFKSNILYNSSDSLVIIPGNYEWIQDKDIHDSYRDIGDVRENVRDELKNILNQNSQNNNRQITDGNLETLASSLALLESTKNLCDDNSINSYSIYQMQQLQKTLALIQNIFNPNITVPTPRKTYNFGELDIRNDDSAKIAVSGLKNFFNKNSNYNNIMKYTKQYYQYQQFKKSYFKCTKVEYDKGTGRIIQLNFEYVKTGD